MSRFFASQQIAAKQLMSIPARTRLTRWNVDGADVAADFDEFIRTDYMLIEQTYFRTIFAASLAKLDFMSSFPDVDYLPLVSALPPLDHVAPVRDVQAMPNRSPETIQTLIERYRHHCRHGIDVIYPRWDEDREFVSNMLCSMPASGGQNPDAMYQSARQETLQQISRFRRPSFERKLQRLRSFLWLREQLRDYSNHAYHLIRRFALSIGDRRGIGEAVFFQTFRDVVVDRRDQIERRRERYESFRNFSAPNEIGMGDWNNATADRDQIAGIGASPGRIRAIAQVASNVEQAAKLPSGGILVCPFTDPGWTAVLDRAAGVITETGGLLSHAAILCREYGIPAVLGVQAATKRIKHGSTIEIDGSRGTVAVISETNNPLEKDVGR